VKHLLSHMSSLEAEEAAQRGAVVLLPIGTVEGNGPQMPMGYDYLFAEAVAREVAERTGELYLPPITYGVSEILSGFPGTVFVTPEILQAQVESILRSLIKHRFEHILIVNNHIPNLYPVEAACRLIRKETGVLVASTYPGLLAKTLTEDIYGGEPETVGHGAEPGTSLMLHLHPDVVRMDLARTGTIKPFEGFDVISPFAVRHGTSEVNLYLDLDELTDYGGWADPTRASAEKGAEVMRRIVEFLASFVERFRELDTRARGGRGRASAGVSA
jgi:creatinine amidohydrolase